MLTSFTSTTLKVFHIKLCAKIVIRIIMLNTYWQSKGVLVLFDININALSGA